MSAASYRAWLRCHLEITAGDAGETFISKLRAFLAAEGLEPAETPIFSDTSYTGDFDPDDAVKVQNWLILPHLHRRLALERAQQSDIPQRDRTNQQSRLTNRA